VADPAPRRSAGLAIAGALSGFLAVLLGAFGAHALRSRLDAGALAVFETAVRYQMLHALALLFVGWVGRRRPRRGPLHLAGWLFLVGTALFSGSLYALALTGVRGFGAVTPLGGLALLAAWLALAVGVARERDA
jgi:uncharacterized membrane protein YgdD (TMEM256/DUF423 family)